MAEKSARQGRFSRAAFPDNAELAAVLEPQLYTLEHLGHPPLGIAIGDAEIGASKHGLLVRGRDNAPPLEASRPKISERPSVAKLMPTTSEEIISAGMTTSRGW